MPAIRGLRQEDHKIKASLGYIVLIYLKKPKKSQEKKDKKIPR
jgi:hypothetical protein